MTPAATTPRFTRRAAVAALAAAPWLARAQAAGPLRICQSTALSGPLADLGAAMHQGAKAAFAAINTRGGVNGQPIELVVADDGYDVKRSLANLDTFLADKAAFALFNCMGTPNIAAMLPKVTETGIPFFAPFSGALAVRPAVRNVINIRASYPDEAEQLVQHLATIGIKRIAVAYQANAFGKEVYEGARVAMDKHRLDGSATATVENTGADAAAAAGKIVAANPEAVLIGLAGKPALEFIKAIRAQRRGLPLYTLSVMGAAATLRALGEDGVGVAISQVVPSPAKSVMPVVRDFNEAWKASGTSLEPSHLALEGFINARVFAEALKRAGRNPTRERFIESTWNIKRYDLGGFEVNFTEPGKNASRYVELTMVGKEGKFIR